MGVDSQKPYYKNMISTWKTMKDFKDGSRVIKNSKEYFPAFDGESTGAYDIRKDKAVYFDKFNPTINGLSGLVFKKIPIVQSTKEDQELSEENQEIINNADNAGTPLLEQVRQTFNRSATYGNMFGYVDLPKSEFESQSKEDEKLQGIRPYINLIQPQNVINWRFKTIKGASVLTLIVMSEFAEVASVDDKYETEIVERLRVLTIGKIEVYEKSKNGKQFYLISETETNLDFIPLFCCDFSDVETPFESYPPFAEITELSKNLFGLYSDDNYALFVAKMPMGLGTGIMEDEKKDIKFSPNGALLLSSPDADYKHIDYKGDGVKISMDFEKKIEMQIVQLGLSILASEKVFNTATEKMLDSVEQQSKLVIWVAALEQFFNAMFKAMALMQGKTESEMKLSINKDLFKVSITADEIQKYSDMVAKEQMSLETMWTMLGEDGRLPDNFDADKEKELISENISLLVGNTNE